jgi:hypothetical protein
MLDWHDGNDETPNKQQPKEKPKQQTIRPPTPEQKKEVQPTVQQQDENWGNFDDDNWADFSSLDIQDTPNTQSSQPVQQKSQPIIRPPTPEQERQAAQKQQGSPVVDSLHKVKSLDEFLSSDDSNPTTKQENSDNKKTGGMDLFSQLEWHDSDPKPRQSPSGDLPNDIKEVKRRSRKLSIHKRSLSTSDTTEIAQPNSSLLQELFSSKQKPMQQAQMTQPNCKTDEECCVVC